MMDIYASGYGGDIIKVTDLSSGSFEIVFAGIMQNSQASFAISDDGTKFFDFYEGTLKVRDFSTGNILYEVTGLSYGEGNYGGYAAVAVDPDYIYTWDATIKTVYVYDHAGQFIQNLLLDFGDNGHSLAFFDGYLFVSVDGDYNIGTWYGYNIRRIVVSLSENEAYFDFNIYPNPTMSYINVECLLNESHSIIFELQDLSGKILFSEVHEGKEIFKRIDLRNYPNNLYLLNFYSDDHKLIKSQKVLKSN